MPPMGVIFPLRTAVRAWGGDCAGHEDRGWKFPGCRTRQARSIVRCITIAGVCTALYMKEALDWAAKNGGATGENVAKGFYQKANWVPAGMEGVPAIPRPGPKRIIVPTTNVDLYRSKNLPARPMATSTI